MGSHHTNLLLPTEIRWLLRGNVFVRMAEFRKEMLFYFLDHEFKLSERLKNGIVIKSFIFSRYLFIFSKLNEACLTLQKKEIKAFFELKITYLYHVTCSTGPHK